MQGEEGNNSAGGTTDSRGVACGGRIAVDGVPEPQAVAELETYLVHLVHLDLPLPQKIALIEVVRGIMQSFVDRAFGDDPVQRAIEVADKSKAKNDPEAPLMIASGSNADKRERGLAGSFRGHAGDSLSGKRK